MSYTELEQEARTLARLVGLTTTAERDLLSNGDMFHILRLAVARISEHPLNKGFTERDVQEAQSHPAGPLLEKMLATYSERRSEYGPSERTFGDLCYALFPQGLWLRTPEDWVRWGLFHQILSKITRYTQDFHNPHIDSVHDIGPYSAMLEAEDRRLRGLMPFPRHVEAP